MDQKWNNMYRISELVLATLIQRYDKKKQQQQQQKKKTFHFKNNWLTENLQAVRCHILWLY